MEDSAHTLPQSLRAKICHMHVRSTIFFPFFSFPSPPFSFVGRNVHRASRSAATRETFLFSPSLELKRTFKLSSLSLSSHPIKNRVSAGDSGS